MTDKFSISELAKLQKEYGLELPTTDRGIAIRAKQENWEYEEVAGRGGKGGIKKIYTLPPYLLEELEAKGLHLFDKSATQPETRTEKPRRSFPKTPARAGGGIPEFMRPMVAEYDDWAAEQGTDSIVPVRYHTNVFGSAGNGYAFGEELRTEAMWFRSSFFDVLGVKPAHCFCTRVKGDSMTPRYLSGDIVACREVHDTGTFFQWGKAYVLDTDQGVVLKRVRRSELPDHILCVSDNPDYEPFDVPVSSIYHLAIVRGLIREE